jgi:hypothetical protein
VRFDEIRFEASVATVPAASDFAVVMLVLLIVVTGSGCVVRCRGLG